MDVSLEELAEKGKKKIKAKKESMIKSYSAKMRTDIEEKWKRRWIEEMSK